MTLVGGYYRMLIGSRADNRLTVRFQYSAIGYQGIPKVGLNLL